MTAAEAPINDGSQAVQDHPEQSDDLESPYGDRNQELPDQLVKILRETVVEFQGQEEYLRRREILRDRRNRFYEQGVQQLYWAGGPNGQGSYGMVTPGGFVQNSSGARIQAPNYADSYNIFQRYMLIIQAILTQNMPGIDWKPDNPKRSEDAEAAEAAEQYWELFKRSNDIKSIMTQIVRMMEVSGRTVSWTYSDANAEKFGRTPEGEPRQMETTEIFGTLESKVPILTHDVSKWLYCFLYKDPDIKKLKMKYPEFAEKLKAGESAPGENMYERWARLGVLQGARSENQTGKAFEHVTTEMHCWLRPASFCPDPEDAVFVEAQESDVITDADGNQRTMTGKEKILALFPGGVHVVFAGDTYVGSWAESMDDALHSAWPYEGDGSNRPAIMDPVVVVQDFVNDSMNAFREIGDTGWPSTWVSMMESEYDAINSQKADPYALRLYKELPQNGAKLQDKFFREPDIVIPESFAKLVDDLRGRFIEFLLATPPALQGEGMPDQKTARGYEQAAAKAMGQQGLVWQPVQYMMARIAYQSALCANKNPQHQREIVVAMPNRQTSTLRMQNLDPKRGKFGTFPDEDSGFPESTQQKRATFSRVMSELVAAQSPVAMEIMAQPDNVEEYTRLNGLSELVIPEIEARKKAILDIEQLLMSVPTMPTPQEIQQAQVTHAAAAMAGPQGQPAQPFQPPGPKSSIPVNPWDYVQYEVKLYQEWLNSEAYRQQKADGNEPGVMNVILHWQELSAIAAQQAAAQMAMQAAQQPQAPKPTPVQLPPKKPATPAPGEAAA